MLPRPFHLAQLTRLLAQFPVVALLGPRQVGKTTLARQLAAEWQGPVRQFDLEDPDDQARLSDPAFVLRRLTGLVVLDEIQTRSDLFPVLRVLADRPDTPSRFLILGSASPELLRHAAETLAGRMAFHELDGFGFDELALAAEAGRFDREWLDARWLRGGFPLAFLAADLAASRAWRDAFIRTYLERDLPQLGINLPALTLRRFWTMVAHRHAQTWNSSEIARSLGVSDKTVNRYLDILEGTYMAYRLLPWQTNLGKREVKAPKVYLADTGILHALLGIGDPDTLLAHPKCGASWEGLVIREVIRQTKAARGEAYFWGVHTGAELDLLIARNDRRLGIEVKLTRSPRVTPSMRAARELLGVHEVFVVCHGQGEPWPLAEGITAVPAQALETITAALD
ncbi:ATP-binding protein [Accumulibacter sp.]|uniref:ATP-binding protein n=1 Tax=Accumulibacter sp. TaxID=2053492 RepID=UPI0025E47742|nr:ATP-binding protein [Accumulibacter sp.]MCM8594255.1 ATP-binding protein [Accumulibacter sp.]MCM8625682.1 ATP-binding protein [Accumulibacter sp.]MDS4048399.1 ATP-binding protein [Accumulibacter sp.]